MSRPHPSLSRRKFLTVLGGAGAAGLLAACGGGAEQRRSGRPAGEATAEATGDVRQAVLDRLGLDVRPDLALVLPLSEFLSGVDQRLLFGLATMQREFLNGLRPTVTAVADDGLEPVGDAEPAAVYENFGELSVYGATLRLPAPGVYWVVAATSDRAAIGAIQAVRPEDSPVPQVGEEFPAVPTPTRAEPMGLTELCTREPDCSMHEVSLDDALAAGRPAVLTVATPAFCQTAVCGPVVDVIEGVRQQAGRDDVAWIHVEVYKDAGNTPVELMRTLNLRSEPWTFFVGGDGRLVDKLEGPTPAELVREAVDKL